MLAKEIMTKDVVTIASDTTIGEAIKQLINNKISGVPVLNQNEEVIGIVTEKDLLVAYDFVHKTDESVKDFMNKEVQSVSEDTPAEEISKLLVQQNIKRVPVVKDKKVLGIVSRRDVLRYILKKNKDKG